MHARRSNDKAEVRDRVVGLERVRAGDLVPHPKNWRTHSAQQAGALRGAIAEVGIADACEQDGRTCFAVELEPRYCDVIVERWQNFTGGKATRKCSKK